MGMLQKLFLKETSRIKWVISTLQNTPNALEFSWAEAFRPRDEKLFLKSIINCGNHASKFLKTVA